MQLPKIPFVVLDTETTGFLPRINRVIEYAHVVYRDGELKDTYEQLIDIPTEIPAVVEVLTRIRAETIKGRPTFDDVREEIVQRIGTDTIIVGQNVSFDIKMLKGEGIDLSNRPWIDTSMLASLVFPELESYSLGYMSNVLALEHEPVHRALGDVRTTLELLARCWERLLMLPPDAMKNIKSVMQRSTPGYSALFQALPKGTTTGAPPWMRMPERKKRPAKKQHLPLAKPTIGIVDMIEEPVDAGFLQSIMHSAVQDEATVHWIAVKNLTSTVERLEIPKGVRVLQPPFLLLDTKAVALLRTQKHLSADEATLLTKIDWYAPKVYAEAPIHGEEKSVWAGKLACTDESTTYTKQFTKLPSVILLDHRQILHFIQNPDHEAHGALNAASHIIIDDASMLEDTANKAYGHYSNIGDLRTASKGHDALMKFTDLLQLWIEKTRNEQDIRYLAPSDFGSVEVFSLRAQVADLREDALLPAQTKKMLEAVAHCLSEEALKRITWIEVRQDGAQSLSSVPESVANLLEQDLFSRYPVTLLLPPESSGTLQETLHRTVTCAVNTLVPRVQGGVSVGFSNELTGRKVLSDPPDGKTIVLAGSKRVIEEYFVEFMEGLEARGITLICQNVGGGINRMQAEFLAAKAPAVWVLTPWTFEGVDLPPGTVDHLVIDALPFDNPTQPVFGKRAGHFRNAFTEYSLPRLLHRMFRLLRTFGRIAGDESDVMIVDKRIFEKAYGKTVRQYVEKCAGVVKGTPAKRPPSGDFPENWQMNLF